MKRIHLFEFEDLKWFPNWIRICMTRLIMVMHKKFNTSEDMAKLLAKLIKQTNTSRIIDLCSGSGGPMLDVISHLKNVHKIKNVELILSDLYPNLDAAKRINQTDDSISYRTIPLDATNLDNDTKGILTMVGSFHHMKPQMARKILVEVQKKNEGLACIQPGILNYSRYS